MLPESLLIRLMLLAEQLMGLGRTGAWPSITLASELDIPADRVFSDWLILNKPIQFVLGDVQLWVVLIFAAALTYWVMDWAGEDMETHPRRALRRRRCRRRPSSPTAASQSERSPFPPSAKCLAKASRPRLRSESAPRGHCSPCTATRATARAARWPASITAAKAAS